MKELSDYLIKFTYDYYCQGYDDEQETVLVKNASSFGSAVNILKISGKYYNPREFHNMTIDLLKSDSDFLP